MNDWKDGIDMIKMEKVADGASFGEKSTGLVVDMLTVTSLLSIKVKMSNRQLDVRLPMQMAEAVVLDESNRRVGRPSEREE